MDLEMLKGMIGAIKAEEDLDELAKQTEEEQKKQEENEYQNDLDKKSTLKMEKSYSHVPHSVMQAGKRLYSPLTQIKKPKII